MLEYNVILMLVMNMRHRVSGNPDINTVATVDHVLEKTIERNLRNRDDKDGNWNETVISRIDAKTGKRIMPSYVLCVDNIYDSSIKAAKYFKVPIYLINSKCYKSFRETKREYYQELEKNGPTR